MADDPSKRRPQDATRINIHEPYEVTYWTKHFGCTEAQLKACVGKVGVMVEAVKKCLGK